MITNNIIVLGDIIDSKDAVHINSIDDISKHKADILIIDLDYLTDLYEQLSDYDISKYKKYDLYEYDRVNRNKYSNYKKVYIVSHNEFFDQYDYKNRFSNIHYVVRVEDIDYTIDDEEIKISNIKNMNITRLKEYVDKQIDYFDSKDIMKLFNVSQKWIKRYMKDMNDIYNNIGYSYSKRKWYKVEGR